MTESVRSKVTATHLSRNAYLYVRQSSLRQVAENQESTRRQYGLRERAIALGWAQEQIVVIDCDLGLSGASSEDREGFQRLVTEVGMARAGIVLGLEVSRVARNSSDWHRLLEICALTDTLILDEDGLYDPSAYNDRLLLGLKGTLSEAELHLLRARMRGGLLAKARRGELRIGLPVGLVYDQLERVVLHPDQQVRDTIALFFRTFFRTGTACATVKHFTEQQIQFPAPARPGAGTTEVLWGRLNTQRAVQLLHNPRYAGAFAYGRRRATKQLDGRYRTRRLPRDQWEVLLLDAHPGYISWDEYERIEQTLHASAVAYGSERRHGPPREGPALLQGRVVCGRCGGGMTVNYHHRQGQLVPNYRCQNQSGSYRGPICQVIPGGEVDAAIGRLLVETMSPMSVEVTLAVQAELETRLEQVDRLRDQQLKRAEHEAEHARVRYMQVDATHRLVATSLEADWNEKLRALEEIRDRVERQRAADRATFDEATKQRIRTLATDFAAVWNAPRTPQRERKRIVALLLEDVTLTKQAEEITVGVRFRGGATTTLSAPVPLSAWQRRQTHPKALARTETLLATHPDAEVAVKLNQEGFVTGAGVSFDAAAVGWLRRRWGLKGYREHLLAAGHLTSGEVAVRLGVSEWQVKAWRRAGRLRATLYNNKSQWLYLPIEQQSDWIQARVACNDTSATTDAGRQPVANSA